MQITYTSDEALLTIGTGPDHGMIDISINGRYWRRFDAYTTQPGERVLHLPQVPTPTGETSGKLSIKVRSDRHHRSTGRVFRFKQLAIIDTTYNERTIDYTYDGLSRLLTANYDGGTVEYTYGYDLAGNLTNNNGKTRTYNATNQLTNDGTHTLTYDANGNLTNDGTSSYTWDHANRLKSLGTTTYSYDGLGNRVQQAVGTTATNYLLDLQPGLTKVIGDSDGNRYVHSPRGIHAMQNNAGEWSYMAQDGLGSVRSLIDSTLGVDAVQSYNPYGEPFGTVGNFTSPFAFTGEPRDANGLQYHRARYYNPSLAIFPSLDPFEGVASRPMSLNGYSWVEGNPVTNVDPSGTTPSWHEMVHNDAFRFSCKCGWLDVEHTTIRTPFFMDNLVTAAIDWSKFQHSGNSRLRAIYPSFIRATGIRGYGNSNAVIDENHADFQTNPLGIALGIFMETNEELERQQSEFPVGLVSSTSFSIEDLVSDGVGYSIWRAMSRGDIDASAWQGSIGGLNTTILPDLIAPFLGTQTMNAGPFWTNPWLQNECDVKSKYESLMIRFEYEHSGGFPKNRHWEPLAAPEGTTSFHWLRQDIQHFRSNNALQFAEYYLPGVFLSESQLLDATEKPLCSTDKIDQTFRTTETYQLLQTAIRSSLPGQGAWWWDHTARTSQNRTRVSDTQAVTPPDISEYLYIVQSSC